MCCRGLVVTGIRRTLTHKQVEMSLVEAPLLLSNYNRVGLTVSLLCTILIISIIMSGQVDAKYYTHPKTWMCNRRDQDKVFLGSQESGYEKEPRASTVGVSRVWTAYSMTQDESWEVGGIVLSWLLGVGYIHISSIVPRPRALSRHLGQMYLLEHYCEVYACSTLQRGVA